MIKKLLKQFLIIGCIITSFGLTSATNQIDPNVVQPTVSQGLTIIGQAIKNGMPDLPPVPLKIAGGIALATVATPITGYLALLTLDFARTKKQKFVGVCACLASFAAALAGGALVYSGFTA